MKASLTWISGLFSVLSPLRTLEYICLKSFHLPLDASPDTMDTYPALPSAVGPVDSSTSPLCPAADDGPVASVNAPLLPVTAAPELRVNAPLSPTHAGRGAGRQRDGAADAAAHCAAAEDDVAAVAGPKPTVTAPLSPPTRRSQRCHTTAPHDALPVDVTLPL